MSTFIKSIIIGICAILPGVSGSVIAVSLGIYDKFISIINDRSLIKNNKKYIIEVVIGLIIGITIATNLLIYLFKFKIILYYSLIGIIISEIPFIIKKIHNYNQGRVKVIPFIVSFLVSLLLDLLKTSNSIYNKSFFKWFIGGILFSFGKVFPGISSSFFLLSLGIYDDIIALFINPFLLFSNIKLYIPFIIGTIIGLIIFIKILNYLMKNKYVLLYSIILGFIISSVLILLPEFSLNIENVIGFILMVVLFVIFIYIKTKNES